MSGHRHNRKIFVIILYFAGFFFVDFEDSKCEKMRRSVGFCVKKQGLQQDHYSKIVANSRFNLKNNA